MDLHVRCEVAQPFEAVLAVYAMKRSVVLVNGSMSWVLAFSGNSSHTQNSWTASSLCDYPGEHPSQIYWWTSCHIVGTEMAFLRYGFALWTLIAAAVLKSFPQWSHWWGRVPTCNRSEYLAYFVEKSFSHIVSKRMASPPCGSSSGTSVRSPWRTSSCNKNSPTASHQCVAACAWRAHVCWHNSFRRWSTGVASSRSAPSHGLWGRIFFWNSCRISDKGWILMIYK